MTSEIITRFAQLHDDAGVFLDFDGTLSEIVEQPDEARPVDGVREVLEGLAEVYRVVAIVSGRSAHQIVEWVGPDVEIWGVHGAQRAYGGRVEVSELARPYLDLMRTVHDRTARALERLDLEGVVLEDKEVMLGLHFRAAADRERARVELKELAEALASEHDLWLGDGKMAFELKPPVELSKKAVVQTRTADESLKAAAFLGDDVVDLPAWDALDSLATEGVTTLRVGVDSDEAPPEVIERADVVVDGPTGAVALLMELERLARG